VVAEVHAVGGKIMPQLWHTGLTRRPVVENLYDAVPEDFSGKVSPSGYVMAGEKVAEPMTDRQVEELIEAYAEGVATAKALGFDGVEIHGAHGYMVDQFFWHETNKRTDHWGGSTLSARGRFGVELVKACRAKVGAEFPIVLRFSQWKLQDYNAKLADTAQELASFLEPLAAAGVDVFHASQRRFWLPEFAGSDLNLAGWAKKITGKPSITVGSVGIEQEFLETMFNATATTLGKFDRLVEMLDRGDFDLVAVGRALLVDPYWAAKLQREAYAELRPYSGAALASLS
jgi:2,4-dienoyl-CoA reductase-like NADH-dependent reductase (Old Yellow Enzyme family)